MDKVKQKSKGKATEKFRGHDTACHICGNTWDGGGCCPIHVAGRDLADALVFVQKFAAMRAEKGEALPEQLVNTVNAALAKAGVQ